MKEMKKCTYILLSALLLVSCVEDKLDVDFGTDTKTVEIGPDGGKETFRISSSDNWIASTDAPWLTISPANGKGTVNCDILIDSALTGEARKGYVRIENLSTFEKTEIEISQEGYPFIIEVSEPQISIENFAAYGERTIDVTVRTNVDFSVNIPDNAGWIKSKNYKVDLDRGLRPRKVDLKLDWNINSAPIERKATISLTAKNGVTLDKECGLTVIQNAATPIPENTRKGDSLAVMGIANAMNTWVTFGSSEPMDNWDEVVLWEPGMEGYTPEKKGRIRTARFYMFSTKEGLPYEVQYLTAAEELYFYSNTNSFLLNLNPGEYITKLTQLKRLTLGAYGLTELPENFKALKNLEYLDLVGNNFQRIPSILTPENFPNLHALIMNAQQRNMIYDLSNTVTKNFGGFYDEEVFPRRMLEWNNLDTLVLSVNYLQGEIPAMEDWDKWTAADIAQADTLPAALIGKPKVLPTTKFLAINLNRLSGELPEWLLYHPSLDYWAPYVFIFSQEGKDDKGNMAAFDNEPANLNYYYEFYKGFKKNNVTEDEDETDD